MDYSKEVEPVLLKWSWEKKQRQCGKYRRHDSPTSCWLLSHSVGPNCSSKESKNRSLWPHSGQSSSRMAGHSRFRAGFYTICEDFNIFHFAHRSKLHVADPTSFRVNCKHYHRKHMAAPKFHDAWAIPSTSPPTAPGYLPYGQYAKPLWLQLPATL